MDHGRSTLERASPSFEEFAGFIREWGRIAKRKQIAAETLFEDDLGITGDDGCELLEEIEGHFGVCLSSPEHGYRQTFGLAANEFLFHSEGFGPSRSDIVSLFKPSSPPALVRALTVGELFQAVKNAPPRQKAGRSTRTSVLGLGD
jgi:hypothetical protein